MKIIKVIALITFFFTNAFAMTPAEETRYISLTKEIRCVVCQNQNIADSDAPLANDLRKKIYAMAEENKSDADIKDYLVARYGEFILLKPRFNKTTLILWLFPSLCMISLLAYLFTKLKLKMAKPGRA